MNICAADNLKIDHLQEQNDLISVAICTYNGGAYISEQLDSVLNQDYKNIEVIIVDDMSSDLTMEIAAAYVNRDGRVKIYQNDMNLGFRRNFERALSFCKGQLIAPCDQDDVWLPSKISTLRNRLGSNLMIYCDSELIDENGASLSQKISDKLILGPIRDSVPFAFTNCVSGHSMLFRRELISYAMPIPEGLFHDWWLAFVAASLGEIKYEPKALVKYRQHTGSVTDFVGFKSQGKLTKPRGHKLDPLRDVEHRLKAMAAFENGREAVFLARLSLLWEKREREWFCPELTAVMVRHRHRFFAFNRDERARHLRRALKYFWGVPVKRIVQPYQYSK